MITLVEFYAPWCGTCKQLKPFLDGLQNVEVEYVNIDENAKKAQLMRIRSLPTVHVYKDDELVETISGLNIQAKITQALEELKDEPDQEATSCSCSGCGCY